MSSCNKGVDKGRKKSYAAPASGSIEKNAGKNQIPSFDGTLFSVEWVRKPLRHKHGHQRIDARDDK